MMGRRLGPYEITAKLGEGGMGEVYRATDIKLKRDVALEALPAAFSGDSERLACFERKAKLLTSLDHSERDDPRVMKRAAGRLHDAADLDSHGKRRGRERLDE